MVHVFDWFVFLLTDIELLDELSVGFDVLFHEIIKQTTTFTDKH